MAITRAHQVKVRYSSLATMALIGFILVAMETMPAGVLPDIATGMNISEGTVGLFISVYALGTVIVTVPAISLTRRFNRKPLLLILMTGLVLANTTTALTSHVVVALASRFAAGSFSGMIWGMLAVYAIRISPRERSGRALAIVSTGAPLGFAFSTPLGAWIGSTFDWRWSFAALSLLAVIVAIAVFALVPDAPGQISKIRVNVARVFSMRGVPAILAVILVWMLAHSTIYTYIAPYLRATGTAITPDLMLLACGIGSLGGIAITGALLDRLPRPLLHLSVAAFVVAGVILFVGHSSAPTILAAAGLWGLGFGGASAQLQSALTRVGGAEADIANSFLPVAFNLAIFGAGILGALLLLQFDGLILPFIMVGLGAVALLATFYVRRTSF
jgi:predicted MFS family arabinose efflux permease